MFSALSATKTAFLNELLSYKFDVPDKKLCALLITEHCFKINCLQYKMIIKCYLERIFA